MPNSSGNRRVAHAIACGALLCVLVTGCGQSVPGTPHAEGEGPSPSTTQTPPDGSGEAAPPTSFSEPTGRPTVTVEPDETGDPSGSPLVPGPLPGGVEPAPTTGRPAPDGPPASTPGRPRSGGSGDTPVPLPRPVETSLLTADVVRNECLLDGAGFAALLGGPVGTPAENVVTRPDGSTTRSCYALSRGGSPPPTGAINVYRVNRGTPASFVRDAAGGRPLAGIGEAAVLLDTVGGSTLQIATPKYLITVSVVDGVPSTERWQAAGRTAADAAAQL